MPFSASTGSMPKYWYTFFTSCRAGWEALKWVDGRVAIPLERDVESLNVAVAAGIFLQHLR